MMLPYSEKIWHRAKIFGVDLIWHNQNFIKFGVDLIWRNATIIDHF